MKRKFELKEVTIVVVAQNHNPTVLNPDFLKFNKIVPNEWELKEPPICVEPMAQVIFKNDVKIVAQLDKVTFYKLISDDDADINIISDIACRYIQTLPHVKYTALGINPKGHVIFSTTDEAMQFILENFVMLGPLKKYEKELSNATVNFSFKYGAQILNLSVSPSMYKESNESSIPVIVFGGNFHHEIKEQNPNKRLEEILKVINNCASYVDIYTKRINTSLD